MLVLVNWIARNVRERSTVGIVHNAVCRSSDSLWLFRFHFNVDGHTLRFNHVRQIVGCSLDEVTYSKIMTGATSLVVNCHTRKSHERRLRKFAGGYSTFLPFWKGISRMTTISNTHHSSTWGWTQWGLNSLSLALADELYHDGLTTWAFLLRLICLFWTQRTLPFLNDCEKRSTLL